MKRAVLLLLFCASGCAVSTRPLEGFDVVIVPTRECTTTGATSQACTDPSSLAQQSVTGRWILERGASETFSLTTEEGATLPGIYFSDDAITLNQAPCVGAGGLCYFARRKVDSTDPKNNNCQKFAELVAILRRTDETTFTGILSDTTGSDANCGTSNVTEHVNNVTGSRTEEPSLAQVEATDAGVTP